MNELASSFGGAGGGHNIAAGASIPPSKLNDFLVAFGEKVNNQLSNFVF